MDSAIDEYVNIFRNEIGRRICDYCQIEFDEKAVFLGLIVCDKTGKYICCNCEYEQIISQS